MKFFGCILKINGNNYFQTNDSILIDGGQEDTFSLLSDSHFQQKVCGQGVKLWMYALGQLTDHYSMVVEPEYL